MIASLFLAAICQCGIAPERADDFYWENDKVGFRAYGPKDPHVWSGIDIFNIANDASTTCAQLLRIHDFAGNWHETPYKGILDNYTIGAGRGLGAVALWGDGEWKTYPNWEKAEVLYVGDDYCAFRLVYPAFSALGKMTCDITLKRGERFFRNEVSFENPKRLREFKLGPGLDLEEKRGHKGAILEDPALGIVAQFEDSRGDVEGSTMTAVFLEDPSGVELATDAQNCRILAVRRASFAYWAGSAWSKSEDAPKDAQAWFALVKEFAGKTQKRK